MKVVSTQLNSKNCIVCGMENPLSLKAVFYNLDDNSVATVLKFNSVHQSYPDRTHGGMISALLDELMGRALWVNEPQMFGVTTTLNVTYRKAVPPDTLVKARAYITFNGSRGFTAKGALYSMDDVLLAEGNAKFFKMPFSIAFKDGKDMHEEMCYQMPLDLTEINFIDTL